MVIVHISLNIEFFESVDIYSGHGLEMTYHLVVQVGRRDCMAAVEVSKNRALQVCRVILERWS